MKHSLRLGIPATLALACWLICSGHSAGAAKEYKLLKTHHGPVFMQEGRALAVKLPKLGEGGILREWYEMSRARTLAECKTAMARRA